MLKGEFKVFMIYQYLPAVDAAKYATAETVLCKRPAS
jgi:hypothetical protein